MNKKFKKSKRGLTFSIDTEEFPVGSKFSYQVNTKEKKIIIMRSEQGNTVSRKVSGHRIKSLFDIRSNAVMDLMSRCDYFEVEIVGSRIIVQFFRKKVINFLQRKKHEAGLVLGASCIGSIAFPMGMLKKVAGGEPMYTQITIDDYLRNMQSADSKTIKKDLSMVYKVISLFSGAGMLDKPFAEDPAFQLVYAVDNELAACESYRRNIGDHIECKSVTEVHGAALPKAEVIIGGPSCKAFSNANRRTRMENHGDYWLVNEYLRITQENNPEVFVIENVPEFLTANEGEILQKVISSLPEYEVTSTVVVDADLGGYTMRKRAIIIGSRIGAIHFPDVKMLPYRTVREALNKVDATWYNFDDISVSSTTTKARMGQVTQGGNFRDIPELDGQNSHSGRYKRLHPDALCPTLVNWRKLPLIHPTENRILSVAEAIALSGFGKDFIALGTLNARQQQICNGVPYSIGRYIKYIIKETLDRYFVRLYLKPSKI